MAYQPYVTDPDDPIILEPACAPCWRDKGGRCQAARDGYPKAGGKCRRFLDASGPVGSRAAAPRWQRPLAWLGWFLGGGA